MIFWKISGGLLFWATLYALAHLNLPIAAFKCISWRIRFMLIMYNIKFFLFLSVRLYNIVYTV